MPSRYRFKPEEQEVPDNVLVVMVVVEAGHDMAHTQLLFGVLQQRDKRTLAAIRQLVLGDRHVEPVLPQHRFPLAAYTAHAGCREGQLHCLLYTRLESIHADVRASAGFQPKLDWVRGISIVPRASALWEFPTCAGDIKRAAEAQRRGC